MKSKLDKILKDKVADLAYGIFCSRCDNNSPNIVKLTFSKLYFDKNEAVKDCKDLSKIIKTKLEIREIIVFVGEKL